MLGRRVAITGIGMLSPLGVGFECTWNRLIAGESGIRTITRFDASSLLSTIAGEIDWGGNQSEVLDSAMPRNEQRKVDPFIVYALCAAKEAMLDSRLVLSNTDLGRCGVLIGSGVGGIGGIAETALVMHERGARRISPHFVPGRLVNMSAGYVSIQYGFTGPNHSVSTACATGTHAIGDAARMIAWGDADVMLAGGAESPVFPIGVAGFNACRALSTKFNDTPAKASRPFDRQRDGFVIAEGAGIVVLEELEHARARGANIYAEVIGYGMGGDAFHATAPSPNGVGAEQAMRSAIKSAEIDASDIDYINAHGTSTFLGDTIELKAIERVFKNREANLAVSSTKSAIGHSLGAAGAMEVAFGALAIRDGVVPPTLNLEDMDYNPTFEVVAQKAKTKNINTIMSNSFGFGGTNACLILRRV